MARSQLDRIEFMLMKLTGRQSMKGLTKEQLDAFEAKEDEAHAKDISKGKSSK